MTYRYYHSLDKFIIQILCLLHPSFLSHDIFVEHFKLSCRTEMADNIHRDKDAHEVSESESGDNQDGSVTSQPENNHGDELKYENGMENDVEIQIEEAVKGDVCNANENAIKGEVKIEQVKIVTEHENDKNSDLLEVVWFS